MYRFDFVGIRKKEGMKEKIYILTKEKKNKENKIIVLGTYFQYIV